MITVEGKRAKLCGKYGNEMSDLDYTYYHPPHPYFHESLFITNILKNPPPAWLVVRMMMHCTALYSTVPLHSFIHSFIQPCIHSTPRTLWLFQMYATPLVDDGTWNNKNQMTPSDWLIDHLLIMSDDSRVEGEAKCATDGSWMNGVIGLDPTVVVVVVIVVVVRFICIYVWWWFVCILE
jgi:hypothetical protein